jgi:hypothetical protein
VNRTTRLTVGKWRRRFVEHRLEGLYDEPRIGALRTSSLDAHRRSGIRGTRTLEQAGFRAFSHPSQRWFVHDDGVRIRR